ncbi:MAG: ATP-binding protein [Kiritimatiellales bacterium]
MNAGLQFVLLPMLMASMLLQFCAAFLAFRLMRLSRNAFAWIMIFIAVLLMAAHRTTTFFRPLDLYAETIAFMISLLLAAGLFALAPLMRRLYSKPETLEVTPLGELFEKITSGVAVYEAMDKGHDFIIRDMNPAAERIEKTTRQDVVGRRLTEAFPGMEKFGLPDVLRRVWKTGRPESFPMRYYQDVRISGWRDNFVYRRPDGEVVAVYNDVSAQMRMQEELERRERKFRLLFEQAPLPYQLLDNEGRILEVNPAWLRLTGLERAAVTGKPFSELLTRMGRQYFQTCLDGLKKGGAAEDVALELRRGDGVLLNVELSALPLRSGAGGEQIYCMLREKSGQPTETVVKAAVEERAENPAPELLAEERRELQRQRLAMLGDLANGMACELSMPLAAARNAFDLMRKEISPASPYHEFVETASRELSSMANLVEQMYRFHEPLSTECKAVDINALLDSALNLMSSRMKERRTQLKDERAEKIPAVTLPSEAVMLTLVNPIKNSIEAMPPDGILTLRTGTAEPGGVFVEIEDNGPGIPPKFMPRLFKPFAALRHIGGGQTGVGLGLAIVQRTLDVLGGSVTVRSNEDEGTCVRIVFPAEMKADGG